MYTNFRMLNLMTLMHKRYGVLCKSLSPSQCSVLVNELITFISVRSWDVTRMMTYRPYRNQWKGQRVHLTIIPKPTAQMMTDCDEAWQRIMWLHTFHRGQTADLTPSDSLKNLLTATEIIGKACSSFWFSIFIYFFAFIFFLSVFFLVRVHLFSRW
jgi:hypothetical protein